MARIRPNPRDALFDEIADLRRRLRALEGPRGVGSSSELIDYTEFTNTINVSSTSEASPDNIVTSGEHTYEAVPHLIEFYAAQVQGAGASGQAGTVANLWDDDTDLGRIGLVLVSSTAAGAILSTQNSLFAQRYVTPSAGAHEYRVRAWCTGNAGGIFVGGDTVPGFIRITRL